MVSFYCMFGKKVDPGKRYMNKRWSEIFISNFIFIFIYLLFLNIICVLIKILRPRITKHTNLSFTSFLSQVRKFLTFKNKNKILHFLVAIILFHFLCIFFKKICLYCLMLRIFFFLCFSNVLFVCEFYNCFGKFVNIQLKRRILEVLSELAY